MDILSFILGYNKGKAQGGSSADVRYVTFMNGETVLYVKPVAVGDDCVDVATKELIEEPTKESTAQYTYTHSGWSLTDGGEADSTALQAVTEDRTVYAAFTESVRNYTVNFYDGETLLKSVEVAYGGSYEYAYSKDNYLFTGWLPEPTNITGDMDCYAQLEESYTFADASWEYIADMSARGLASTAFALGDTKDVEVVDVAGRTHTLQFHIVGFNHDDLADGTGKAGISIVSKEAFLMSSAHSSGYTKGFWSLTQLNRYILKAGWEDHPYRTTAVQGGFMDGLPTALRGVIKEVTKKYDKYGDSTVYSCTDTAWIPSTTEMLGNGIYYSKNDVGEQYEYYKTAANRKKTMLYADGTDVDTTSNNSYGTRQACSYGNTYSVGIYCNTGLTTATSSGPGDREVDFCPIGFCI